MKLFLTSSTITPELVKLFEELANTSIKNLKCVFLPDAAYGVPDSKDISWVDGERQYLIDNFNWKVTDLVLRDIDEVDPEYLSGSDVIFVNGGFSGYLAKEMRRTGFDKALPTALEEGVVYVGSSAGSMVCSKTQNAAEFYINEPEEGASAIPGLALVDFEIYPHFNENIKEEIESLWKKGSLYLLKDGEAIVVNNGVVTVLGEERVISK
ncbi:Type 1 glutamine amidotransferase-like domain-containing protein [Patescibacteria group bacterium]|nr:Type 1 glutamine amidotransferase-like domain-containing protein [Patescibacteria group bacterium]